MDNSITIDINDFTLYEDEKIIILNKPKGLAVQTEQKNQKSLETLLNAKYPFVHFINRVDQVVSGIVMIAKTSEVAGQFGNGEDQYKVKKTYLALVEGHPPFDQGRLRDELKKKGNKAYIQKDGKGKKCILDFEVHKKLDRYTFLNVVLKTGRFHQIRCQLSHAGFPIKGDVKYGARRSNKEGGIYLHCNTAEISNYPNGDNVLSIKAPHPSMKLWELLSEN